MKITIRLLCISLVISSFACSKKPAAETLSIAGTWVTTRNNPLMDAIEFHDDGNCTIHFGEGHVYPGSYNIQDGEISAFLLGEPYRITRSGDVLKFYGRHYFSIFVPKGSEDSVTIDYTQKEIILGDEIFDADGDYMLRILNETTDGSGFNLHALLALKREEKKWVELFRITNEEFDAKSEYEFWICKLYKLDPSNWTAIIKVAESIPEVKGQKHGLFTTHFSWRLWDLKSNKELEFLQECKDPFDPYAPK